MGLRRHVAGVLAVRELRVPGGGERDLELMDGLHRRMRCYRCASMGNAVECASVPTGPLIYVSMRIPNIHLEILMYIGLGTILVILLIVYFIRRA